MGKKQKLPRRKRVLIIGASKGVGKETVKLFADAGYKVLAVARDKDSLTKLKNTIGTSVCPFPGNIADPDFTKKLSKEAGNIDILVYLAARTAHGPFLDSDPEELRNALEINVEALVRISQLVAQNMVVRKKGHIIIVSSILARQVYPLTTFYAATKHAVAAIVRGMRIELAEFGIRVTEIAPGLLDTSFMEGANHPHVIEAYAKRNRRRLSAKEVAGAIFYASQTDKKTAIELISLNPLGQV